MGCQAVAKPSLHLLNWRAKVTGWTAGVQVRSYRVMEGEEACTEDEEAGGRMKGETERNSNESGQ